MTDGLNHESIKYGSRSQTKGWTIIWNKWKTIFYIMYIQYIW